MQASRRERAEGQGVVLGGLKKRSEFLRLRGGPSWNSASFVMVSRPRIRNGQMPSGEARFGFTVTKRLGNAVKRNRARRRLKEAVRLTGPAFARPGFDYVVIARSGADGQVFTKLLTEFEVAFDRMHRRGKAANPATES